MKWKTHTHPYVMSASNANAKSIKALDETALALQDIRKHLQPLLKIICYKNDSISTPTTTSQPPTMHQIAVAQAGIALTLGTLRYLGPCRFGLLNSNSSKNDDENSSNNDVEASSSMLCKLDPKLRTELNDLRKLLVQVQKRGKEQTSACQQKLATTKSTRTDIEQKSEYGSAQRKEGGIERRTSTKSTPPSNRKRQALSSSKVAETVTTTTSGGNAKKKTNSKASNIKRRRKSK